MNKEELIQTAAYEFALKDWGFPKGEYPPSGSKSEQYVETSKDDFSKGINSDLNKSLTELAVLDGRIEVLKKVNDCIYTPDKLDDWLYDELKELETKRTELLAKLNLEE